MKNSLATIFFLFSFLLFGQTENFWTKKGDFTGLKRERAVGFTIGNFGYICSGLDTAELVQKDLWKYNPILDVWTQKADLPGVARRDAIGFSVDSIGYVGTGIDNNESMSGIKLNDFWAYNPTTNSWLQKADFPGQGGNGLYFATAFDMGSKGYVCGGKAGPNNYSDQLWEYKPNIDAWSERANFPGGIRYQMSSFSIGVNGYVGFGADEDVFRKDLWEYNGGTNQWTQKANLPASERSSAVAFSIGLRGFICTGNNGGLLGDLWEFNPFSNTWAVRAPYGGTERKNAIAFVVNNRAYVGTGKGYSGKKTSFHEYSPYANVFLETPELISLIWSAYPNPAKDIVNVSFENSKVNAIQIYSSLGILIQEEKTEGLSFVKVDVSKLNSGSYILVSKDNKGLSLGFKKMIIN
jgi:N-acetylneuraminic acid mutarotase